MACRYRFSGALDFVSHGLGVQIILARALLMALTNGAIFPHLARH